MSDLTHVSLFTGVGGLDIAAEEAGFKTAGQCEWADYPRAILDKHWPNVYKWRDIKALTKEDFFEKTGFQTVNVISGGFPCQPFSCAGNRRGTEDDRYLWPEMLRVIRDLQPHWVVGENVANIVNMALDTVLTDLENEGYTTGAFIIPAVAVNAPHRRDRVAIIGYKAGAGEKQPNEALVADTINRWYLWWFEHATEIKKATRSRYYNADGVGRIEQAKRWESEPGVGRVAYGIPFRLDRLKCLGNAVVPWQFYPIFKAISEIEALYNM